MAAEMFQKYVDDNEIPIVVKNSENQRTHTAQEAADVHGVKVSNIIKSLLLKAADDFILVLVPGDKRLDLDLINDYLDAEVRMATPDEVKDVTGYSIGGVPPFGHVNKLRTYIVDGFDTSSELLGAAGSATTVFRCDYEGLIKWTDAEVLEF